MSLPKPAIVLLLLAVPALVITGSGCGGRQHPGREDARSDPERPPGAILRIGTQRFRHRHGTGQAVYSPDGTVIASASLAYGPAKSSDDGRTGVVEFWEAASGQLVARCRGRKVAFAGDGRSVAVLDLDAVRVYDWPNMEQPRAERTRDHQDLVEFGFAPDGTTVVLVYAVPSARQQEKGDAPTHSWSERRILAWNAVDDEVLWDVPRPSGGRSLANRSWNIHYVESSKPCGIAFSPDGSLVAVHFVEPDRFFLLEAATGRIVRDLDEAGWRIAAWFSPDGQTLYSAREDLPRSYTTGEPEFVRQALEEWDVATGERRKRSEIPEPLYDWSSVAPSPDGKLAVIGTRLEGAVLGVLDLEAGKVLWSRAVEGLPAYSKSDPIPGFSFSPDQSKVAASLGGFVHQWDVRTGEELPQSRRPMPDLTGMSLSPDGSWIAVAVAADGSAGPHIRRLDAVTGVELDRLHAEFSGPIVAMAVSPDGAWLSACDTVGNLRVWDVASGRLVREFEFDNDVQSYLYGFSRESRRQAVAFSADGRWHVVSSAARVYLLDVADGWKDGPSLPIEYDKGALNGGFILPGSSTFVAAKHTSMRAIDLSEDEPRVLADVPLSRVIYAVAPSPDGRSVALITGRSNFHSIDQPTTLVRIDPTEWQVEWEWQLPDSARISALAWPTENVLVCGENDGQITLRDAVTGRILRRDRVHCTGDLQFAVSTDRTRWASLGKSALVWDTDQLPTP